MCWTGICAAVKTGLLIPIIDNSVVGATENVRLEKSVFAFVPLGIGEILGSLFIGYVIDHQGNRPAVTCTVVSVVLQAFFLLVIIW